jgi:hypothetical protein
MYTPDVGGAGGIFSRRPMDQRRAETTAAAGDNLSIENSLSKKERFR